MFLCPLSMATDYLSVLLQSLGGAAYGLWCSYNRQGALCLAARATGSRSYTWTPDLLTQKLPLTTYVFQSIGIHFCSSVAHVMDQRLY